MQGMIGHHAQAVEMTELLTSRTASDDMRKLALRIEVSQADEIKMMQRWLEARGQEVPDPHAHAHARRDADARHAHRPRRWSGSPRAKGAEFDRLFLEGMIKHHGGALTMVQELFATPGAGQESEIFAFASDVDADQRMEIDRMGAMLKELSEMRSVATTMFCAVWPRCSCRRASTGARAAAAGRPTIRASGSRPGCATPARPRATWS